MNINEFMGVDPIAPKSQTKGETSDLMKEYLANKDKPSQAGEGVSEMMKTYLDNKKK